MFFNEDSKNVLERFDTEIETGLTEEQVITKRSKHGYNELDEQKATPMFIRFLQQFKDPMIIMLLVAAAISMIVDPNEWIDSLIILIVVTFNAVLGMMQEAKAEESLEALKEMSAPLARVLRDGRRLNIPSKEILPGDIIYLEAGDFVPVDARIIEAHNLKIDESALTGESEPVSKHADLIDEAEVALGDRKNMAFSSSIVTYGRGVAVVTGTAMDTEVGKIADLLLKEKTELTPLQLKLADIGKIIGIACIVICIAVFGLEIFSGETVIDAFKTAVALAVAAIPEGLPTVVTIVLAIGVQKMSRQNAIVRSLPAVETLGSASIVCSDKTGTLTQNKMTVVKTYLADQKINDLENVLDHQETKELLDYFTLSSDAEINIEKGEEVPIGDPTETALVSCSLKFNQTKTDLLKEYQYVGELSFDSTRKLMSVIYKKDGKYISITKGAPDVILSRAVNAKDEHLKINEELANQALRVLAVAYKEFDEMPTELTSEILETDIQFVGLVGMIDPPRPEVKEAIELAKGAGVRTVMITGDHAVTASAIARELGILDKNDKSMTGADLEKITDDELIKIVDQYSVYARVAPEHKVRIVKAWQANGHVVAMTGDGVNDSPALKAADIGCAMGITGTDVAKSASAMILTDDNFATIIHAIEQGRGIFDNIQKDVHFLLSSNIGEVVAIFFASLIDAVTGLGLGVPLLPIHLLWVNLITDSLPAFALGMEEIDEGAMQRPPRKHDESFFSHGLGFKIAWQGVMIGALTLMSYLLGNQMLDHASGMTMAFITLSISELFHAYNLKSDKSIFNKHLFNNKYLNMAFIVGLLLQLIITYVPFFSNIFQLVPLDFKFELIALGLAFSVIPIVEISKLFSKES